MNFMHERTKELIKRLLSPGSPGSALSASEFHELADATSEAIDDSERLDWLEANPLPTQVIGGQEDGHIGKVWAVSCHQSVNL